MSRLGFYNFSEAPKFSIINWVFNAVKKNLFKKDCIFQMIFVSNVAFHVSGKPKFSRFFLSRKAAAGDKFVQTVISAGIKLTFRKSANKLCYTQQIYQRLSKIFL
jgi:hypothetical protein